MREPADAGIEHVPVDVADLGLDEAVEAHALGGELGLELAVRADRVGRERALHVHDVELAALEREPARLVLFHDGDLDAPHLRHLLALHLRDQLVVAGLRRREVPDEAAIVGIRVEHDLGAAHPLAELVGAGADRVAHARGRRIRAYFSTTSRATTRRRPRAPSRTGRL